MQERPRRFQLWPSLALASVAAIVPAVAARAGGDAARLASLVRQDCGSCHGLTLKGGLGKPLTPEHLQSWSRDQLVGIILDGVPGTPMPPWRPLLSEPDARWIAERLQQGDLP
ncbi:cytochrome c [Bradyrhizobium sp. CCBAU 53338]|nr:cytochrome c [Bradyrhizobium sp. CCBAU 53338]